MEPTNREALASYLTQQLRVFTADATTLAS